MKKTKPKKNSKDYIYCCSEEECPFELKFNETENEINVYTSANHTHSRDYVSIGKTLDFLLLIFSVYRIFKQEWDQC